ncbi:helix-turn-helix transcriptional regulator [Clostridium sp. D33t1_170424_F3]|uniref:helix-turn-helix domain-containing protein n=1 Tax=Clostridium sp. D33t1_170424_F3 TaxID=2787099 RepID=UPI0018AACF86|nr:helix-turn-helix transcriptional regulator [Clostridium sp. D33t1_170424_F3]
MYKRIRELRVDKDLGQKELADYLQVHQTTYSDYELGNVNIPNAALVKLAEYYGTSTDYLLELTDDPRPYKRSKNFGQTKK